MGEGKVLYKSDEKFVIASNFDYYVKKELERRKKMNGGKGVIFADVYEDIANCAGITTGAVQSMRNKSNPSLTVSVAIAEYFKVEVSDIWKVVPNLDYVDMRGKCTEGKCNRGAFSKNLCFKHYNIVKRRNEKEQLEELK